MTRVAQSTTEHQNVLLVAVQAPYHHKNVDWPSYVEEFKSLVTSCGIEYKRVEEIKLREIDPGYFITKGKLEEISQICQELNIETVIFSEILSVKQERNLEDFFKADVVDRTRLILDIFAMSAITAEGKAQVQIAYFEFLKTRVAGKGIEMSQQAGIVGIRGGFGETAKEKELRHIHNEIEKLKATLDKVHATRETQRKHRLKTQEVLFCLIGYTNAGKSSILNALTKSDVLAEDKLFATLDTTTRKLYINSQKVGVLSDTVGFIQQLPTRLIEAFKSTLSELQYANLLLQVVDLTDVNWQVHIDVVHQILAELKVDKPLLYIFNKADKIEDLASIQSQLDRYQPHVVISTKSKEGIEPLANYLLAWRKENFPSASPTVNFETEPDEQA